MPLRTVLQFFGEKMNRFSTSARVVAFLIAALGTGIHFWFLRETSGQQVLPTTVAMGSLVSMMLTVAFFGNSNSPWVFKTALVSAMTFCAGVAWLMVASGSPDFFYKIWGGIAALFAIVMMFIPNSKLRPAIN